jgi:hypothetical protein
VLDLYDSGKPHGAKNGIKVSNSGGRQSIDLHQMVKINMPGNDLQWILSGFDFVLARSIGSETELDVAARTTLSHRVIFGLAEEVFE